MKTTLTCVALVLAMFAAPAAAQLIPVSIPPADPEFAATIGTRLALQLESPEPAYRAAALQRISYYGTFANWLNLENTVDPLVRMFQEDDMPALRRAAVQALFAIRSEKGMQEVRLAILDQEPSVQIVALGALVDHYGGPQNMRQDREMRELAQELVEYYQKRLRPVPSWIAQAW